MLAAVGAKQVRLCAKRCGAGEHIQPKVPTLELALAEVTPLGEGDRATAVGAHRHCIAVDEIERQHKGCSAIGVVRIVRQAEIVGEDLQHVIAAFGDIVLQQFDAIAAHQREQCIMPFLEVGLAEFDFYCGKLALQDRHQKVATAASGFEKAGVDALRLPFDKVEHLFDQPRRGENLSMIGDALFGLNQTHES